MHIYVRDNNDKIVYGLTCYLHCIETGRTLQRGLHTSTDGDGITFYITGDDYKQLVGSTKDAQFYLINTPDAADMSWSSVAFTLRYGADIVNNTLNVNIEAFKSCEVTITNSGYTCSCNATLESALPVAIKLSTICNTSAASNVNVSVNIAANTLGANFRVGNDLSAILTHVGVWFIAKTSYVSPLYESAIIMKTPFDVFHVFITDKTTPGQVSLNINSSNYEQYNELGGGHNKPSEVRLCK